MFTVPHNPVPICPSVYANGAQSYLYCIATADASTSFNPYFAPGKSEVVFKYDTILFRSNCAQRGISRPTQCKFEQTYPSPSSISHKFIVLMPHKVWTVLDEWFKKEKLPTRTRTTYTRIFFYFYYWITIYRGRFSRPLANMVGDLRMNNTYISDAIEWLVSHQLLCRTTYAFNNEENRSRVYYLPRQLWPAILEDELIAPHLVA